MRDVYAQKVTSGHCPAGTTEAGTTEKVNCWPMPEVPNNIDMRATHKGRATLSTANPIWSATALCRRRENIVANVIANLFFATVAVFAQINLNL